MLPLVGALAFTALLVVALVADMALLQIEYRRTSAQADRIAEGAASRIDEARLRSDGLVRLDVVGAHTYAAELATAEGIPPGAFIVDADPDRICITVARPHEPMFVSVAVGSDREVRVRSCAAPGAG